jgi:hypothetical protein
MAVPSKPVISERAKSFSSEACFMIALQRRRLQEPDPMDDTFVFRCWADLQFLVIALRRLRRAAELAKSVCGVEGSLEGALSEFDRALPGLRKMRDVGEHIDDYARGQGYRKDVDRRQVQVGTWDGRVFKWLDNELDIDGALLAAEKLFHALNQTVTDASSIP